MKKMFLSASLCLLISGCATTYQPLSFGGGYSETQLDFNVYTVTFSGNGHTTLERAGDMALLRAADLMLASGHAFFAVISERERNSTSAFAMPTYATTTGSINTYGGYSNFRANTTMSGGQIINISKPTKTMTVFGFKERPNITEMVYDAKFVTDSIRKKHNIKP